MANTPYINTVPLGQAGTGAAYVLPRGSSAADKLLETLDYNRKVAQQNQQLQQQQAQKLAQSYRDNAFKAKNGSLFNNELMKLQQQHVQQGQEYAKQGFDIYNPNPQNEQQMAAHEQYMADRARLYNYQDVREQMAKHLSAQDALLSKAKPGEYNPKSIQELHDFYGNNTLADIVNKGLQAPSIREAFNPSGILSKGDPVVSPEVTKIVKTPNGYEKVTSRTFLEEPTFKNVESEFISTPGGVEYLVEQTGLSPEQARIIPNDFNAIKKLNDSTFRSKPEEIQALARMGITSYKDPRYEQLLTEKSATDFAAKQKYNSLIKTGVDYRKSKAKEIYKSDPYFGYEDQAMQRESNARARARFNERNDSTQPAAQVISDFTIPIKGGERGANVKPEGYIPINSAVINLAGSPSYNLTTGERSEQVLSSGDHQLVGAGNFPFIKKGVTKDDKLAGSVATPDFATKNPQAIEYRPMLQVQTKDEVGGIEDHLVPYDRLPANTPKAIKTALGGFKPASGTPTRDNKSSAKTVPVSKIKALVGKRGYEGYTEKELIDYYKSQGYTIK